MPIREETPGQSQDTMERLYFSVDLGTSWYLPGGVGASGWGEECLVFPAETASPCNPDLNKKMTSLSSTCPHWPPETTSVHPHSASHTPTNKVLLLTQSHFWWPVPGPEPNVNLD